MMLLWWGWWCLLVVPVESKASGGVRCFLCGTVFVIHSHRQRAVPHVQIQVAIVPPACRPYWQHALPIMSVGPSAQRPTKTHIDRRIFKSGQHLAGHSASILS